MIDLHFHGSAPTFVLAAGWRVATRGLLGIVVALAIIGTAAAQTIWLDAPPSQWNTAGAPVPAAPPPNPAQNPACTAQERGPSAPEETLVANAGWKLETYWPIIRGGNLALVTATSTYDGMCRPVDFQVFVFSGGRFAGTLSPVLMVSRTDGVLNTNPVIRPDGKIEASFTRYAPTDPLCCPSRGHTLVTYGVNQTAAGPLVVAEQFTSIPPAVTPVPSPTPRPGTPTATPSVPAQLPRTGTPAPALTFGVVSLLLLAGGMLVARRVVSQRSE